jgi:uncharacterized protein (DUF4415 family)
MASRKKLDPTPPPAPEPQKRGPGRPKGSTAPTRKGKLTVTLDEDLIEWAKAQGNASATITMALKLLRRQTG